MNKTLPGLIALTLSFSFIDLNAQVDIDKSINLSGSGSNAKVTGIKSVTGAQDAVSAEVLQQGGLIYADATSTGSNYAVALNPSVPACSTGMVVNFKADIANTGPVTLSVNGFGPRAIKKDVSADLDANDIIAGQLVTVIYDGNFFQLSSRTQVNNTGGTVTQVNTGAGLTGGPITTTGAISIPNSGVTNGMLQNSSVALNPGTGLTGGGSVALGGSTTLNLSTPVAVSDGGTGASGLTGAVIGNGVSAMTAVSASSALHYLRRNAGNTAYEFGQINYSDVAGTPGSLPPGGAAGGDLTGTYPAPTLVDAGTAGSYNYVTTDAKGRVTSGALRTVTGTTNQIGVANGNFASGNPVISIDPSYSASLKSQSILTGGANITFSGGVLSWSNRFIVICNGRGPHFTTDGYFDIAMPANGTSVPGLGGAGSTTVSGGISIPGWTALYYILPIGSGQPSIADNFRLVGYTSGFVVPENWILLAICNGDDGTLRLGTGITLSSGQTWLSGIGIGQNTVSNSYIQNQNASVQSANYNISGLADAGYLHTKTNDSWFPYTGNNHNYFRGTTYAFSSTWYDEDHTGYYLDPNNTSQYNYMYRNYGYNGHEYDANDGTFYVDPNDNNVLRNFYQNDPSVAAHNIMGDLAQWLGWGGLKGLAQYQYNYLYPGRVDGGGWQNSWYLASHGSYGLYMNTGLNISGALYSAGNTAIDAGAGWHRSYGNSGWYNGSYAGGWYMEDGTWIRKYGGGSVLSQVNSGSPAIRGDQAYSGAWGAEFYSYDYNYGPGVYVGGWIQAYYIYQYSTREKKKDIEKFKADDYNSSLAFMDKLELNYYRFKGQDNYPKIHVGLISEETPTTLTAPGKQGVAYGDLAIFATGAVKALKNKVENLEKSAQTINDFGAETTTGAQGWVSFTNDFAAQLNGAKAIVTVMCTKPGVDMSVSEITGKGFKVETNSTTPVSFNWVAMAKVKINSANDGAIGSKFTEMLQSAENDTRPIPKLSERPTPSVEDPKAPWKAQAPK